MATKGARAEAEPRLDLPGQGRLTLYLKITAFCSIEEEKAEAIKTAAQAFEAACGNNGVTFTRADVTTQPL